MPCPSDPEAPELVLAVGSYSGVVAARTAWAASRGLVEGLREAPRAEGRKSRSDELGKTDGGAETDHEPDGFTGITTVKVNKSTT